MGQSIVLDIQNAGEVPQEVRDRFFSKYATHGKKGGTGLGAYSARLMAQVQGGDLFMTSRQGATILSLRLPPWRAAPPKSKGRPRRRPAARPDTLPALSVLLVDDDEYNIVVLKNLLPSPPLKVRTAVNGRAALELVGEERPDVIFMDVEMPIMGGIEAARRIRELQKERGEAPSFIAAFSAHDDERTHRKSHDAGFDLYLVKPASREEVFAVLRREDPADAHPARTAQASTTVTTIVTAPSARPPADPPLANASTSASASPEAQAATAAASVLRVAVEPSLMHLMPEFLSSRRVMAQTLVSAAEQGERETIRVTAHKLAGSLAMYGFKDASRACLEVEKAAPEGDLSELRARCGELVEMISNVEPVARSV
jgi:CheY-like chemotaxis protein